MKNTQLNYELFKSTKEADFDKEVLSLIKDDKINFKDDYNWNDCKEWRKTAKNETSECYNVADEFSEFLQALAKNNWQNNQSKTETQNLIAQLLKTTNKKLYNEVGDKLRSNEWYNNYVTYHSEYAAKEASKSMGLACDKYKVFNTDIEKFKAALKKVMQSTSVKSFDKNVRIIITLIQQLKIKMENGNADFYRFMFYFYSVTRGTGKGILVESLLAAMKKMGFISSEVEFGQLFNQFNNCSASTNFLVAIKEAPSYNQLSRVEWSKYNNTIDNTEYEVERKGVQPTMAKSIATFIAATNYRLNQDNRRNLYIDMNEVEFILLKDKDTYSTKDELTEAWIELIESCPANTNMNFENYLIKNQDFLHNGLKNSLLDFIQVPAFDKNDILKNWKNKSPNNLLSPIANKSITYYLKEMLEKEIIKVVNNLDRLDRNTFKITDPNALFDYIGDVQEGITSGNSTMINKKIDTFFDSLITPPDTTTPKPTKKTESITENEKCQKCQVCHSTCPENKEKFCAVSTAEKPLTNLPFLTNDNLKLGDLTVDQWLSDEVHASFNYKEEPEKSNCYIDLNENKFPVGESRNPDVDYEYETLNPVGDNRNGGKMLHNNANCLSMRNFLFEFDNNTLEEQINEIKKIQHICSRIVFSGSKSIHCIVSVKEDIKTVEQYKYIWDYLNKKYFGKLTADLQVKNPARLTRRPSVKNKKTGKEQKLLYEDCIVVSIKEALEEYRKVEEENTKKKEMKTLANKMMQDLGKAGNYTKAIDTWLEKAEEGGSWYGKGSRNSTMNTITYFIKENGLPEEAVEYAYSKIEPDESINIFLKKL